MASAAASSLHARAWITGATMKFFLAGGAVALAVMYLIVMGLQNSSVYFLTVSELEARAVAGGRQVYRVSGQLVPGTLSHDGDGLGIQFKITDASSRPLAVTYRGGQVPDIIGDNVEIVAEGRLDSQGTFVASSVLAKCPSRLENAPPEERDYRAAA